MAIDIDQISKIIEDTAAEEVMPRFRTLSDGDIRDKGRGDLVTVADLASEAVLTERLAAALPGSRILGEEAVTADPSLFEQLRGDSPVWTIDPIDGTGNFARGRPVFAVMVALVVSDAPVAAWIHDPVNRRMVTAETGSGTWSAGQRLTIQAPDGLDQMSGTIHASTFARPDIAAQIQRRRNLVNTLKSMSCAGWEYLRLVHSEMNFSMFTRLMPWDHVPGALLFQEAGGVAHCIDGTAYRPTRYEDQGLIMAPNEDLWHALHQLLFGEESRAR